MASTNLGVTEGVLNQISDKPDNKISSQSIPNISSKFGEDLLGGFLLKGNKQILCFVSLCCTYCLTGKLYTIISFLLLVANE